MDYVIAGYLLRTHGELDSLSKCGLKCFEPFIAHETKDTTPTMDIVEPIEMALEDFPTLEEIHSFPFDAEYATCHFCRYDYGKLLWMEKDEKKYILAKEETSNKVFTNFGLEGYRNSTLLRFGLWVMFGCCIAPLGGIAIHSSVAVHDNKAILCLGESGTGKSTHTRLWIENIPQTTLLNDDSPIIRMWDGVSTAFGSPWSGKTPCYKDEHYPIKAFIRLSQAPHNKIRKLPALEAIGALLPSCPPSFAYDTPLQDNICNILSDMICSSEVYHLECLPNSDAAKLSYKTIFR
ncbi:MAG: hypothetical protein KBS95_06020 [Alistipes sp.]|nr:hypothetical protein [Candidatus Alistipes equi]